MYAVHCVPEICVLNVNSRQDRSCNLYGLAFIYRLLMNTTTQMGVDRIPSLALSLHDDGCVYSARTKCAQQNGVFRDIIDTY